MFRAYQNVTLNTPFVTTLVPVAVPDPATTLNAKVPVAPVAVDVISVMVPLPPGRCAARIVRSENGVITAYDGDRRTIHDVVFRGEDDTPLADKPARDAILVAHPFQPTMHARVAQ